MDNGNTHNIEVARSLARWLRLQSVMRACHLALVLSATLTASGCVTAFTDSDPLDETPCGKCDDSGAALLSSGAATVLLSPAYLDALDEVDASLGNGDWFSTRQLLITAYAQTAATEGTLVYLRVESAPALRLSATPQLEGYLEALVVDGSPPVVEEIRFLTEAPGLADEAQFAAELAPVWGDLQYRSIVRDLLERQGAVQFTDLATFDEMGRSTVMWLRQVPDSGDRYELVVRHGIPVEGKVPVESIALWANGVIADVKVQGSGPDEILPDNAFFVYDDAAAFDNDLWAAYSRHIESRPLPHIGREETVIGFVTHYFPYIAKDMAIESVADDGDEVVVKMVVTWNGFGCFEAVGCIHLFDMVKVKAGDRPIALNVYLATGPGCPIGGVSVELEPRLVHQIRIEADQRNQISVCEATGDSGDPPFESCSVVDGLPID